MSHAKLRSVLLTLKGRENSAETGSRWGPIVNSCGLHLGAFAGEGQPCHWEAWAPCHQWTSSFRWNILTFSWYKFHPINFRLQKLLINRGSIIPRMEHFPCIDHNHMTSPSRHICFNWFWSWPCEGCYFWGLTRTREVDSNHWGSRANKSCKLS